MPPPSVTSGGIALLCFPPYDRTFAAHAERRLAGLSQPDPDALQASLRPIYPRATVRPRESLAAFRPDEAWYVYRDGRYSPFSEAEAWWEDPAAAWIDVDDSGDYVDANDAALDILGVTLDELRGLRSGDLSDPAASDIVEWTRAVVLETGVLHSTTILRARGDRPRQAVEYRLVTGDPGSGRHRSHMRPIPVDESEPTSEGAS